MNALLHFALLVAVVTECEAGFWNKAKKAVSNAGRAVSGGVNHAVNHGKKAVRKAGDYVDDSGLVSAVKDLGGVTVQNAQNFVNNAPSAVNDFATEDVADFAKAFAKVTSNNVRTVMNGAGQVVDRVERTDMKNVWNDMKSKGANYFKQPLRELEKDFNSAMKVLSDTINFFDSWTLGLLDGVCPDAGFICPDGTKIRIKTAFSYGANVINLKSGGPCKLSNNDVWAQMQAKCPSFGKCPLGHMDKCHDLDCSAEAGDFDARPLLNMAGFKFSCKVHDVCYVQKLNARHCDDWMGHNMVTWCLFERFITPTMLKTCLVAAETIRGVLATMGNGINSWHRSEHNKCKGTTHSKGAATSCEARPSTGVYELTNTKEKLHCEMGKWGGGWAYVARGSSTCDGDTATPYGEYSTNPAVNSRWSIGQDKMNQFRGNYGIDYLVTMGANNDRRHRAEESFRLFRTTGYMDMTSPMDGRRNNVFVWTGKMFDSVSYRCNNADAGPCWEPTHQNHCCQSLTSCRMGRYGEGQWSHDNKNQHLRCDNSDYDQDQLVLYVRPVNCPARDSWPNAWSCFSWAMSGFCQKTSIYHRWMKGSCQRTCCGQEL